jgi:hypothetical protein
MKKKPMRRSRRIIKILGVGFSVFFIIVAGLILIASIHQAQTKKRIDKNYHSLKIPNQLTFQSATWTPGSIDFRDSWTYTYTTSESRGEVFSSLENSLQASGYSIDYASDAPAQQDYITARNQNNKLYLIIQLLPRYDNGVQYALKSVSIDAEEY